jgi:hypothetical protein
MLWVSSSLLEAYSPASNSKLPLPMLILRLIPS